MVVEDHDRLFVLSLLPCLVDLVIIYVADNPMARALIMRGGPALDIDRTFFLRVLETQCWFALVLAAWIAPRLVSFDLGDNALPILLSHPISRFGYLLGKFVALALSLSYVTWIPCLMLFVYQCYASPQAWGMANFSLALGIFAGAVVWVFVLSMVGLAVSAWVKWRVIATGAIFAVVFVPAGVGGMATLILRTRWGSLLNLPFMMSELWQRMLGAPAPLRMNGRFELPTFPIVVTLVIACLLCVAVLNARIRAREVVRG